MSAITSSSAPTLPSARPSQWRVGIQVLALILIWWGAQTLTTVFRLPIPGSVLGLMLLWAALDLRLLRLQWIEQGAGFLLNHLMLFFVPAMLALVDRREFLSFLGVKLLFIVLLSTLIVMCGTALIVELGFRWSHARTR